MAENSELKEVENEEEEKTSLAPYVNEKLKYYLIAVVIILCIVTALVVVFSPEAREKRKNDEPSSTQTALLVKGISNT